MRLVLARELHLVQSLSVATEETLLLQTIWSLPSSEGNK